MREQARLPSAEPVKPIPGTHFVTSKSFVLASHPSHQKAIQCVQRSMQRRRIEAPVIANPAQEYRLGPLRQCLYGKIVAQMQLPATYTLPHRFG